VEKHVFYAPVRIGQKIYVPWDGEEGEIVDELTITEVGSRGCFVSDYTPPEDDLGTYFPYRDLGRTWFTQPPKGGRQSRR
jgi:hypothetical protein